MQIRLVFYRKFVGTYFYFNFIFYHSGAKGKDSSDSGQSNLQCQTFQNTQVARLEFSVWKLSRTAMRLIAAVFQSEKQQQSDA